ncbi:hypothetical protein PRZ48_003540 [Zasmidium cellare]|uniref:Uncharacterized protein n=1 Tax=Zasmidium cellare TaxID=395010 RepID=A0ABR0EVC9_ZASCE|nr:hypothetical protein PRZ48_003540 [Zasmidium cellare]
MLLLSFLTIFTIFTPLVSSWSIAFYSGDKCDQDPNFSSSSYSGSSTDMSWCLQAGEPGQGCQWHTNSGATSEDCSVATQPMPGSFRYEEGSQCCVEIGDNTECLYKECEYPGPGDCYPTKYMPFKPDGPNYLTFTCGDAGWLKKTIRANDTDPSS